MSLRKMIVACATAVMASSLGAANYYNPYCEPCPSECIMDFSCDPREGWTIYGDWLYWRARRCDLVYAVDANVTTSSGLISSLNSFSDRHSVSAKWDSGFRLGILKECGNFDFGIHYTHFHADDKNKVTSDDLPSAGQGVIFIAPNLANATLPTALQSGTSIHFASGKYELDYDILDVEIGYDVALSACGHARGFAGFKHASIDQKFVRFYSNEQEPMDNDAFAQVKSIVDLDAYGLYIGADAGYTLGDCFEFFGIFSYAALPGEFDSKYVYTRQETSENPQNYVFFHDHCWKLVSNLNLAIGAEYTISNCFCADWAIAFGYEFHQWFCLEELSDYKASNNFELDIFGDRDTCLGLDGLFVRVAALF